MSDANLNPTPSFCYNHPTRETTLRCNRCDRPICPDCAMLTPTGYRCKECVRGQQKIFETAEPIDYPIAIVIAGLLSFLGSLIARALGFWTIFLAPAAGVAVAEVVRWAIRRHRSPLLFKLAAGAAVLGGLPVLLFSVLGVVFLPFGQAAQGLLGIIWPAVYVFFVTTTLYTRLSGIQLGR